MYEDPYGNFWEVGCAQDNPGIPYAPGAVQPGTGSGTASQGIYACFKGCAVRPGCYGFVFGGNGAAASETSQKVGSGKC